MKSITIVITTLLAFSIASCTKSGDKKKYGAINDYTFVSFTSYTEASFPGKRLNFYASSTNTVYNSYAAAMGNTDDIDICFVFDSVVNGMYLVSPDALSTVHMPALVGGTHCDLSVNASITNIIFYSSQNDSLMVNQAAPTSAKVAVDNGMKAYVYKNNKGKIGILYGNGNTGIPPTGGQGVFEVKVQQ